MRHEGQLEGREWHPRNVRTATNHHVRVHCPAGEVDAAVINVSSDGFRLRTDDPLEAGWEVTLHAYDGGPVKALICWASGHEAGGVFAEAVAL